MSVAAGSRQYRHRSDHSPARPADVARQSYDFPVPKDVTPAVW
jgi:hypothetical protein